MNKNKQIIIDKQTQMDKDGIKWFSLGEVQAKEIIANDKGLKEGSEGLKEEVSKIIEKVLKENVICIDKKYKGDSIIDKHSVVKESWLSERIKRSLEGKKC